MPPSPKMIPETPQKPSQPKDTRSPQANGHVCNGETAEESPWRGATDPVSRQILWELGRLVLHENLSFREGVERIDEQRNAVHNEALRDAAAKHEEVRRTAELVREQHETQLQARREQEALRERKKQAALEFAAQQERLRLAREAEALEQAAADARREQAAALERARVEKEKQEAEAARLSQEQQEAERRAADQKAAEQRAAEQKAVEQKAAALKAAEVEAAIVQASQPPPVASAPISVPLTSQAPQHRPDLAAIAKDRGEEHDKYLQLHRKLKEFRKNVVAETKTNKQLKSVTGDSRRSIRKCVGQLTEDPVANKKRAC